MKPYSYEDLSTSHFRILSDHVPYDLEPPALPIPCQRDVLRLYERELISEDRALEFLHCAFSAEDLPPLPPGRASEIWQLTS